MLAPEKGAIPWSTTQVKMKSLVPAALAAGLLLGALVAPTAAVAHTPAVLANCSTLTVSLKSYETRNDNPKPNSITVTVDDTVIAQESFGNSYAKNFAFNDQTKAHSWKVVIDALGTSFDRTDRGTSTPCTPPTPTPTPQAATAALSVTPASCTTGETLVLGTVTNARWETPTATTGPAAYSVTARADDGARFDDGHRSKSFSGNLAGPLDPTKAPCYVPPPVYQVASAELSVTPATCTTGATLVLGTATNAHWETPTAVTGPSAYSVTARANDDARFDGDHTSKSFSGILEGKLDPAQAPCYVPPVVPPKPDDEVTTTFTEKMLCSTNTVERTTTTTTTPWTLDTAANAWVKGTPVSVVAVTTRAADTKECTTNNTPITPGGGGGGGGDTPGNNTPTGTTNAAALAVTGVDPSGPLAIAALLMMIGLAAAVVVQRRMKREQSEELQ